MNTRNALLVLAAAQIGALAACAYEAPLNTNLPTNEPLNSISGTLVFAGDEVPSQVIVFVFDATNPPPPVGTGRPVTFSTVPGSAFTQSVGDTGDTDVAGASGLLSAPFTVPYLKDTIAENGLANGYLITAVMDQDDNFIPLPTVAGLSGSTYGDWTGAYISDLTTLQPTPVFVQGGMLLDGVSVLVGNRQPIQRPAITRADAAVMSLPKGKLSIDPAQVQKYRLKSTAIHTDYGDQTSLDLFGPCPLITGDVCEIFDAACKCDPALTDPSETGLWVWFVDKMCIEDADGNEVAPYPCEGGDGLHDPYPAEIQAANGLKDTWPRVYIEYMGDATTDADGNVVYVTDPFGRFDFEGPDGTSNVAERWVGESFPMAYELNFGGPATIQPEGTFAPFPVNEMSVTWSPVVRHYHEGGTFAVDAANGPYDLIDLRCVKDPATGLFPEAISYCEQIGEITPDMVPAGDWRITVITHTGQTWIVPNEIGLPGHAALAGFEPLVGRDGFDVTTQTAMLQTSAQ